MLFFRKQLLPQDGQRDAGTERENRSPHRPSDFLPPPPPVKSVTRRYILFDLIFFPKILYDISKRLSCMFTIIVIARFLVDNLLTGMKIHTRGVSLCILYIFILPRIRTVSIIHSDECFLSTLFVSLFKQIVCRRPDHSMMPGHL